MPQKRRTGRTFNWIVKLSKFCNLRCRYCYEWDGLDDPARLDLDRLFEFMDSFAREEGQTGDCHNFIWHGGEPLALPLDYLESFLERQRAFARTFEMRHGSITNAIQTNLFSIKPHHLELLRSNNFLVGVSFDGIGGVRVDRNDRETEQRIAVNMQTARKAGLKFGAITVVGCHNIDRVPDLYSFFRSINCPIRFLPIYRDHLASRYAPWRASQDAVFNALIDLYRDWIADENRVPVHPFAAWLDVSLAFLAGTRKKAADRSKVAIIDTDRTVYSVSQAYDSDAAIGRAGESTETNLMIAARIAKSSQATLPPICNGCAFRNYCIGQFAETARPETEPFCGVDYRAVAEITRSIASDRQLAHAAAEVADALKSHSARVPD